MQPRNVQLSDALSWARQALSIAWRGGLVWFALTTLALMACGGLLMAVTVGFYGSPLLWVAFPLAFMASTSLSVVLVWPVLLVGCEHFGTYRKSSTLSFLRALLREWKQHGGYLRNEALFSNLMSALAFCLALLALAYSSKTSGVAVPALPGASVLSPAFELVLLAALAATLGATVWAMSLLLAHRLQVASANYWLRTRQGVTQEQAKALETVSFRQNTGVYFFLGQCALSLATAGALFLGLVAAVVCFTAAFLYAAWMDLYGQGKALQFQEETQASASPSAASPAQAR